MSWHFSWQAVEIGFFWIFLFSLFVGSISRRTILLLNFGVFVEFVIVVVTVVFLHQNGRRRRRREGESREGENQQKETGHQNCVIWACGVWEGDNIQKRRKEARSETVLLLLLF